MQYDVGAIEYLSEEDFNGLFNIVAEEIDGFTSKRLEPNDVYFTFDLFLFK